MSEPKRTGRGGPGRGQGRKKGKPNAKTVIKRKARAKAVERTIDRFAVTEERVLAGLAQIAFADIRKAVTWERRSIEPDGAISAALPDGLRKRYVESFDRLALNQVTLIDAAKIDAGTAAAITEVKQSDSGAVSIKFADKRAALVDLGKHLGVFVDRHKHEVVGKDGGPIEVKQMSPVELARAFEEIISAAAKQAAVPVSSPSNEASKSDEPPPDTEAPAPTEG